ARRVAVREGLGTDALDPREVRGDDRPQVRGRVFHERLPAQVLGMSMALTYGVGMGRTLPIHEVAPHVKLAEELGYEHATFIDSQALSRDCVAMMTLAA